MKKLSIYVLLAALSATAFSCSDDDKDDVQPTKTSLLTAKSWRATDIKVSGQSVFALVVDDCQKDDLFKFNANNVLTYNNGTNKCDPSEPATQDGSWSLQNNDTQITITYPSGEALTGTISTLTATTLVVTGSQDLLGTGTPLPVELTLTAQ